MEINKILKALNKVGIRVAFCIDEVSNTPTIQKLAESIEIILNDCRLLILSFISLPVQCIEKIEI